MTLLLERCKFYLSSSCNSLQAWDFPGPWTAGTVNSLVFKADGGKFVCFWEATNLVQSKGLVNDQHHSQVLQTNVKDVA